MLKNTNKRKITVITVEQISQEFETLPEEMRIDVLEYINYLKYKLTIEDDIWEVEPVDTSNWTEESQQRLAKLQARSSEVFTKVGL